MPPSNFQAKPRKVKEAEPAIDLDIDEITREEVYVLPTLDMEYQDNNIKVSRIVLTPELVAVAIYEARGYLSVVARKLGTTTRVVKRFVKDYEICKVAVEESEDMILDFAEAKLIQKIKAGDIASIIFYLRTKGKDRGYTEKQLEKAETDEKMQEEAKREATEREELIRSRLDSIQQRISQNLGVDIDLDPEDESDTDN